MLRRAFISVLTAACLIAGQAALSGPAWAHRMPVTVTTIERLPDGMVGITHRMHLEEAMKVIEKDPDVSQPDLSDLANQARLALYIDAHFILAIDGKDGEKQPVELEILGAETEDDYIFVYQQTALPDDVGHIWLRSGILKDISNDWVSHINVETGGIIQSVTFSVREKWRDIVFY